MKELPHPIQPIVLAPSGIYRFKQNAIVRFLLDAGPFDMNVLACGQYSDADREQFAQLIGYSVESFCDLSYASPRVKSVATGAVQNLQHRKLMRGGK